MAPQSGYVSNSYKPVCPGIERVDGHCFHRDPPGPMTCFHGGRPVWTRLELFVQRMVSGYAVNREDRTIRQADPGALIRRKTADFDQRSCLRFCYARRSDAHIACDLGRGGKLTTRT